MYILSRFVLSLKKISEEGSGGSSPTEFSKRGGGIFNDKKSLQAKIFFSVITKNSNWEILSKNLVTFKR